MCKPAKRWALGVALVAASPPGRAAASHSQLELISTGPTGATVPSALSRRRVLRRSRGLSSRQPSRWWPPTATTAVLLATEAVFRCLRAIARRHDPALDGAGRRRTENSIAGTRVLPPTVRGSSLRLPSRSCQGTPTTCARRQLDSVPARTYTSASMAGPLSSRPAPGGAMALSPGTSAASRTMGRACCSGPPIR